MNNYSIGEPVKVSINLRGREWVNPQGETKYFNSIQGWRIEGLSQAAPSNLPPVDQFQPAANVSDAEPDDFGNRLTISLSHHLQVSLVFIFPWIIVSEVFFFNV